MNRLFHIENMISLDYYSSINVKKEHKGYPNDSADMPPIICN